MGNDAYTAELCPPLLVTSKGALRLSQLMEDKMASEPDTVHLCSRALLTWYVAF